MKTIDLHVHSNVSDGSFSPSEVAALAFEAGLSAFALTDHDCTDGCHEAARAAARINALIGEQSLKNHGNGKPGAEETARFLEFVPAVEISAGYNDSDIHILGYYIDPDDLRLNAALSLTRKRRFERNIKMIKNFTDRGIDISYDELTFGNPDTIITRGHFSRLLIEKGYAKDRYESFEKYLNKDTEFFVKREYIGIGETVSLIHQAGGLAFLAHPLLYRLSEDGVRMLASEFKKCGGDGIEAIYSSNTGEDGAYVRSLADEFSLLISGGTDFHGKSKPDLKIGSGHGEMSIPYELLEKIKEHTGVKR